MALIWRKHLGVGNAMLDFEHKSLLGMVNSIEYAINTKDSFALLRTIKLFNDGVHIHFANEARFAREFNFHFERHELAHQHLRKELQHTLNQLIAGVGAWPEHVTGRYPQFLRDWLIGHITNEDMQMKRVLQNYPYDFKPA